MSSRYDATKRLIESGGQLATYYNCIPHNISTYTVSDETHSFATHLTSGTTTDTVILDGETNLIGRTVDWDFDDVTKIVSGTQVITSGSTVCTPTIDYTIDCDTGTITRVDSGHILYGGAISVDYQWQRSCIDKTTGSPEKTCPQCSGTGFFWGSGTSVIGLPHIPKYDSPYTKIGYWQTGDMLFTVPNEVELNVKYDGTDGLFIRDRVVINNEEWRVMSTPETIQLNSEVLAKKLHLRRYREVKD